MIVTKLITAQVAFVVTATIALGVTSSSRSAPSEQPVQLRQAPSHDSATAMRRAVRYMQTLERPVPGLKIDTSRVRLMKGPATTSFTVPLFRSFPDQEGFLIQLSPNSEGLGGGALLWVDDNGTITRIKVWG